MKIPLAHDPFPPVAFSPDQERQLKWLSDTLLEETLAENDDFVVRNNRVLDKAKWRHVMRREDVSIYKRVGKGDLGGYTPDISLFEPTREPHTKHWRVPTCVGVGTMVGSLDDLLYGLLATTKTETDIRTTYIKDEAADSRVLANVIVPTAADPLCALLVRWSLMHQIVHHLGVTPRDVVNMESIGTRVLPSGERIGYIVLQSVDVPGCDELTHLGVIRSKFSSCFVFRDTGHGSLELFMRGFIETGGSLGISLAVYMSCMSLIAAWRLMIAGQNKKLAYVARTNQLTGSTSDPGLPHGKQLGDAARSCTLCLRTNSRFRSLVKCDLCLVMVCSRCVDKRKLTHVKSSGTLVRVPTRICKSCLTTVSNMNASDIAVNEHVPSCARDIRQNSADSRLYGRPARVRAASPLNDAGSSMRDQSDTLSSFTTTIGSQSQPRMSDTSSRSFDSDAVSVASGFSSNMSYVGAGVDITAMSDDNDDDGEWQSWLRMGQLRLSDEGDDTPMLTTEATHSARPP